MPKSTPKGWWVNPSDEIKAMIEKRCEESMRTPAQEIVWILREWERKNNPPIDAEFEKPPS